MIPFFSMMLHIYTDQRTLFHSFTVCISLISLGPSRVYSVYWCVFEGGQCLVLLWLIAYVVWCVFIDGIIIVMESHGSCIYGLLCLDCVLPSVWSSFSFGLYFFHWGVIENEPPLGIVVSPVDMMSAGAYGLRYLSFLSFRLNYIYY